MGKVHFGASDRNSTVKQEEPVLSSVPMSPSIEIRTVEVPVEVEKLVYIDRVVEVPVEVIVERIIERPIEVMVERIVEKLVEVPVEKNIFIDRPVEIIKETRIIDIEKLMIEREHVRLLKRSNSILRAVLISFVMISFLVVGVLHG